MVPKAGLEPAQPKLHAPQTCASTNSATWANGSRDYLLTGAGAVGADCGADMTDVFGRP